MNHTLFCFNPQQRTFIEKMKVSDMIELFSLDYKNIADFLYALRKQPRSIIINTHLFQLSFSEEDMEVAVHHNILSYKKDHQWTPLSKNYRILGIYLSEQLNKDPFLFLHKPEKKKPKITILELFFEMGLSDIGKMSLEDILKTEIVPPRKQRALQKAVEKMKKKRQYTVKEIFTQMPLSRVGQLSVSEFFTARVFGNK